MAAREEARDAAVAMRNFTVGALCSRLGCSRNEAYKHVLWMLQREIVRDAGFLYVGGRGRPGRLYQYVRRVADPAAQHNGNGHHKNGNGRVAKGATQIALASSPRTNSPELNKLLDIVEAQGARVLRTGDNHLSVRYEGDRARLPSTPSKGRGTGKRSVENVRAKLKRMGLQV